MTSSWTKKSMNNEELYNFLRAANIINVFTTIWKYMFFSLFFSFIFYAKMIIINSKILMIYHTSVFIVQLCTLFFNRS